MQVPPLVEPALERAAREPGALPPRRAHGLRVADGQEVRRAVRHPHAGLRRGDLHDALGVVGGGMLHRLVRGGDPERRTVVVGSVVQPAHPPASGVDRRGQRRRAVRAEHELRSLDLHLETQPPLRQTVVLLEPLAQPRHRLHLPGGRHLGQREPEPGRQLTALEQRRQEEIERTDAASPRRHLQALESDADVCGRAPPLDGGEDVLGRPAHVGVLGDVAAVSIAVFEVQAQVLDRLGPQLRLRAGGDVGDQIVGRAEQAHDRRHPSLRRDGGQSGRTPFVREGRRIAVARHVDGVNRLPAAVVAGVALREEPVGRCEEPLHLGERRRPERGSGGRAPVGPCAVVGAGTVGTARR